MSENDFEEMEKFLLPFALSRYEAFDKGMTALDIIYII